MVNFEASLEKAISVNALGVTNVIEFCKKHDAAMMHVSTCYAAGVADGHRYDDDIAENWCPIGKRNFNLQREIREAQATVARIEAESRDQIRQAELWMTLSPNRAATMIAKRRGPSGQRRTPQALGR